MLTPDASWGWLRALEGDRAVVRTRTRAGVRRYRLAGAAAPVYDALHRTALAPVRLAR